MKRFLPILLLLVSALAHGQSVVAGAGVNAGQVNTQTGTSYTIVAGDQGKLVTFSNASPVAVTLPQATGQFGSGWFAWFCNYGAGAATITPTTSTINGGGSQVLGQNVCSAIFSDGTNYSALSPTGSGTQTIATNTATMGTSAIASGACSSVVTVAASGVATTDVIIATSNVDPTGVTGYAPSASGSLYIQAYPTTNNVNFKVCNNTSGSITPSALTLNFKVVR